MVCFSSSRVSIVTVYLDGSSKWLHLNIIFVTLLFKVLHFWNIFGENLGLFVNYLIALIYLFSQIIFEKKVGD